MFEGRRLVSKAADLKMYVAVRQLISNCILQWCPESYRHAANDVDSRNTGTPDLVG